MSVEATVEIDVSEFANDGQFCEIIEDIVKDTLRSDDMISEEVEGFFDSRFSDYFHDHMADTPANIDPCLLYTSPSPRDGLLSRMPSSA